MQTSESIWSRQQDNHKTTRNHPDSPRGVNQGTTTGEPKETHRRHPGDTQQTPGRNQGCTLGDTQETPRKHPGDTQEAPRGTQEAPTKHPGGSAPEKLEKSDFLLIFATNLTNGRNLHAIHNDSAMLDNCHRFLLG